MTPEERARSSASRAATIAATRPTTRPGSEATDLEVGDAVRVARESGRSGTWGRYDGRTGYVVVVNRQTFPSGSTYVELGVSWDRPADLERASADVWFRADELELVR